MRFLLLLLPLVIVLLPVAPPPPARAEIAWPGIALTQYGPSFEFITELANARDGSGRLFVVEKHGVIRIIEPGGQPAPGVFLDISDRVGSEATEQGLLGLAFSPNYAADRTFYVNYTDLEGDTVVARFLAPSPLDADEASEQLIFAVDQPESNHNGGHLDFGPDGLLYMGMGDGGGAGGPGGHSQRDGDPLGKLLRYDPATGDVEEWAKGLRNPWKFSFDSVSGDLYIADVGQNEWEEVNFVPGGSAPGLNFGWNRMEGSHCYPAIRPCSTAGFALPVTEYSHDDGCSVTGGYVVRDGSALDGIYLFSDYCSGTLWGLRRDAGGSWERQVLGEADALVSTFGVGEDGTLYFAAHDGGWRVMAISAAPGATEFPFRVTAPAISADR